MTKTFREQAEQILRGNEAEMSMHAASPDYIHSVIEMRFQQTLDALDALHQQEVENEKHKLMMNVLESVGNVLTISKQDLERADYDKYISCYDLPDGSGIIYRIEDSAPASGLRRE